MKNISILGSTGSIGTQSLDVCRMHGYCVKCLTANSSVEKIEEQIREFKPELVCLMNENAAKDLRARIKDTQTRVVIGMQGLIECATYNGADIVLNSVVGMIGLMPTLEAIKAKKTIALANKETLVAGGHLVTNLAKENGVSILPVDSEHSAIFQAMQGAPNKKAVKKIILTASGGPFRTKTKEELAHVTKEDALRHPNWNMGAKITIDSATMMNKGFEVMEAKWLFGIDLDKIEVVVHPQSIVHSMVEFIDGSVKAQLGLPDMRIPIRYALGFPERLYSDKQRMSVSDYVNLTFEKPDYEKFPMLQLAYEAAKAGGNVPCVLNAANEIAVDAFLKGKISFNGIAQLVENCLSKVDYIASPSYEDYVSTNQDARSLAEALLK